MWILILFDHPMKTKEEKKNYRYFLDNLKTLGFSRLQLSVYMRHLDGVERTKTFIKKARKALVSPNANIAILRLSDFQFERVELFKKGKQSNSQKQVKQLAFF